ncbi:YecR family lipoprotein [Escherichia marmotae]|uniref:YecR family lipoprotein n=1 Tax=Escherichia marmotae TaxID=1499973 RepID=UPI001C9BA38A|nr:YecR family lipoprotein [Escherichia marmotae]MBY7376845.1 YecR-like lipofamily protein [Escherichia marmotae]MBY7385395.1 YecR-like lipofamily protein [Escherichia marmotae]MBY7483055.1 YecR-like lipofamily protein [Escherichia marmotae]MBY7545235.1 YecR-like lipofamily protein [Escherichia marmotae]MEC9693243.1 YecR family lipoprotein [Escherichia marmotae]
MKHLIIVLSLLTLAGCTVTRQAQLSEVNATSGIVRLVYDQAFLQNARTDSYLNQEIAQRACQQAGFTRAIAFGQPVSNCSVFAGSLCLNTEFTLSYQCQILIRSTYQ